MKFQRHVKREVRDLLSEQLKEYEAGFTMTREERRLLHEWVSSGHSPYDNGNYIYGAGVPLDFVSALRCEQELQERFNDLSEEEKEAELQGIHYQYDTVADEFSINLDSSFPLPELDEELPF